MKNSLMVPVVFLTNVLLLSVVIAFFSVLSSYNALQLFSSGKYLPFFIETLWIACRYAPLTVSASLLVVFVFLMRHTSKLFISIPLVLLLISATLVYVFPVSYQALERITAAHTDVSRIEGVQRGRLLSPGIIRTDTIASRMIWFRIADAGDAVFPFIVIDSEPGSSGTSMSVFAGAQYFRDSGHLVASGRTVANRAAGEDPVFARLMNPPWFVKIVSSRVTSVMDAFQAAFTQGLVPYLIVTGSFFLAVLMLWFVCYMTGWRLLNIFLVTSLFATFYLGYSFTVTGPFVTLLGHALPSFIPADWISPLVYVCFSAIVFLFGIAISIRRFFKRHAGGGSYA